MIVDVRNKEAHRVVTQIIFADMKCLLRPDASIPSVDIEDSDGYTVRLRSEEEAENLIKALELAIKEGFFG